MYFKSAWHQDLSCLRPFSIIKMLAILEISCVSRQTIAVMKGNNLDINPFQLGCNAIRTWYKCESLEGCKGV